jgi:predicted class III extradiol MEMO1 family dioxygenase
MGALQYFLSKCIGAMEDFSNFFFDFVILNHIWPQICDILPIESQTFILENLRICNKAWKELVDTSVEYGHYLEWAYVQKHDKEIIKDIKKMGWDKLYDLDVLDLKTAMN